METPRISLADQVIYEQCSNLATTAVQLARCLVSLLKVRDFLKQQEKQQIITTKLSFPITNSYYKSDEIGETDWITKFRKWIWSMLKPNNAYLKKNKTLQQQQLQIKHKRIRKMKTNYKTTIINTEFPNSPKFFKNAIKIRKITTNYRLKKSFKYNPLFDFKNNIIKKENRIKRSIRHISYNKSIDRIIKCQKINIFNWDFYRVNSNLSVANFISKKQQRRLKRSFEFKKNQIQNLFKPNANQRRRKQQSQKLRTQLTNNNKANSNSLFSFFDNISATRSAIKRGIPPNQPWFMKPIIQGGNYLKRLLFQDLNNLLSHGRKSIKRSKLFSKEKIHARAEVNATKNDEVITSKKINNKNTLKITPALIKAIFEGRKRRKRTTISNSLVFFFNNNNKIFSL